MARAAVAIFTLHLNDSEIVTPTEIDASNDMSVVCVRDDLALVVYNSAEATKTLTIKAKSGVAAEDIVLSIATTETRIIGNLESALYKQTDGKINLDFEAGFTGTIYAIKDAI